MSAEIRNLHTHDHPCLIYESKEEQAAAFVPYLQAGLIQGERCIYIADENSRDWVVNSLRLNNFPIDDYIQSAAFLCMTKDEAYLKEGYFDTEKMCTFWADCIEEANEAGFPAIRAAAEMSWALSDLPGCEQLVGYESHLNSVFPAAKVSALCQYNRKRFTAQVVKEMIHVHPLVVVGGELIDNPGFRKPEEFVESHAEMDVQALLDSLSMTKKLVDANAQLREALAEKERVNLLAEQRNEECEYLYQELQQLAKVVSHELQAPLNVMQSYLRLLSARYKSRLGADADEFIEKSCTAALVVDKMIDDLWSYARVDSPSEARVEDLDTADVLAESLRDLQSPTKAKSAKIEAVERLPRIRASREHLRTVFCELLSNSLKYSRPNCAPQVSVGYKEDSQNWFFYVKDNGRGLDKIHSVDVFRLFSRLKDRPGVDGTGMGLAICKRVIDYYRGKIWFEPNVDEDGTTFWFSIPKPNDTRKVTNLLDFAALRESAG